MNYKDLTNRAKEICYLAVECYLSDKQIADALRLSIDTIKNHMKIIRSKLNVVSRMHLGKIYYEANYDLIRKDDPTPAPASFGVIRRDKKVFRLNKTETVYKLQKAS